MKCPYCAFDESNVMESRDALEGKATRRRRSCVKCEKRFTTYERVENIEIRVIKKDGRVEEYQRTKLERCFEKACWKLDASERGKLIDEIERRLLNYESVQVPSKEIAKLVMETLKNVDQMAYIRFATVYMDFKNITDINNLLKELKQNG